MNHVSRFFDLHLKAESPAETHEGGNPWLWVAPLDRDAEGARTVMFKSAATGEYYAFTIYLPESYGEEGRRFPVTFHLHGRNGRPHSANGFMRRAHRAMRAGDCPQMVIVGVNGLPLSMYCDSKDGRWPIEKVIVQDLIPYVEATYEVVPLSTHRAIDGFSMGGVGAARLGFAYPDLFGGISILGAAIHPPEYFQENRPELFKMTFGNDIDYCRRTSPWVLVRERAKELKGKVIRLHVGANDERLLGRNVDFHHLMDSLGIDHTFSVVPDAGHHAGQVLDGMEDPWGFYREVFGHV